MSKKPVKQELSESEIEEALKLQDADLGKLNEDDLKEAGKLPVDDEEEDEGKEKKDEACSKKYKMKKEQVELIKGLVADQQDIPQELAEKIVTVFEALVVESVNEIVEQEIVSLKEEYEEKVEAGLSELAVHTKDFMSLKIDEWKQENQVALIAEAKVKKADAMLEGLKTLFVENNVVYDQETIDLVEEANKKVSEIEAKFNESIATNISLKKKIDEQEKQMIFKEMSADLSMTDSSRLSTLISEAQDLSPNEYKSKLQILKETVFAKQANNSKQPDSSVTVTASKKPLTFAEQVKQSLYQ